MVYKKTDYRGVTDNQKWQMGLFFLSEKYLIKFEHYFNFAVIYVYVLFTLTHLFL